MLPDAIQGNEVVAGLHRELPDAVTAGSCEFGEVLLEVNPDRIAAVCRFLRDAGSFERVSGISVIDRYPVEPRFEVIYLLHSIRRNQRIKLKASLPGQEPRIDSVTGVWPGANWYEREAYDMFGVVFRDHPNLKRILMPEEWEGHPLRKDFPVHGHKYSYQQD